MGSNEWLKALERIPIRFFVDTQKKAPKWIHWQGCCIETLKTSQIVSIHCHCHLWALLPAANLRMCSDILHFTTWWYLDRVLFEPFPNGITLGRSNEFWLTVMTWHLLWDEHLVHICLFKSKERLLEVPPPLLLQNIPTANPARSHGLGMNFILSLDLWPVHAQKITIHFLGLPKSGTLLFHTSQKNNLSAPWFQKYTSKLIWNLWKNLSYV